MVNQFDDMVWEKAMEMFDTEMPTDEQLNEAYTELYDKGEEYDED